MLKSLAKTISTSFTHFTTTTSRSSMPKPQEIKLPGFGLPFSKYYECFPVMYGSGGQWRATTLSVREVCMLKFIDDITDKPEWWLKVNDDTIAAKWKKEAMEMPWDEYREHGDFTQTMADFCIDELRKKAEVYQKTSLIPVMDYDSTVIKSDKLIPQELREALKSAVAPLENVPDEQKDWHPGSDGKVLDIVHPSLWPLVYGRSRILPDKRINAEEALAHCGEGVVIPEDTKDYDEWPDTNFSREFQWLPCDVDLKGDRPRIDSYINNVHPVKHAALYPVIEKLIEKSLPAWDLIYGWESSHQVQRIKVDNVRPECRVPEICKDHYCCRELRPLDEDEPPREEDEEDDPEYDESERFERDDAWFKETHYPDLPEPEKKAEDLIKITPDDVETTKFFGDDVSRIQVIVKLANIHLTPENPTYDGGSWHVEGLLNEHICATALYYYDCDNITESRLDFRTIADKEDCMMELSYEQGDYHNIERVLAIDANDNALQDIGSVLTRQDRMLFFPNIYQHHVSPFELADKSRPGHRKILALFLVDPEIPIISTANVPPQQKHWWSEVAMKDNRLGRLPPELTDMVVDNMEFPISLEDAKKIREELMDERSVAQGEVENNHWSTSWNFCEH